MAELDRMNHAETCAIAVMAKAPQPGRSKTRLGPPLSIDEAAALAGAFLRDITENIVLAARTMPIDACAAYAPAGAEALFEPHLAPGTRLVLADGSGPAAEGVQGFGRCLWQAAHTLHALGYGAFALLNSDGPTLPTPLLRRAVELLLAPGERIVFGPADDGGYYLIGMQQAHAHLFADIAWSTEVVAEQTRARIAALGLDIAELPQWYDVDDEPSLRRLVAEVATPADDRHAPHTARLVKQFALAQRLAEATPA
jgi:rSAM/selenodomain-associated transferase 1